MRNEALYGVTFSTSSDCDPLTFCSAVLLPNLQRHLLHDFGTENFQGASIRLVLAGFLRHELVFDLNADNDPLEALTAAISQVNVTVRRATFLCSTFEKNFVCFQHVPSL